MLVLLSLQSPFFPCHVKSWLACQLLTTATMDSLTAVLTTVTEGQNAILYPFLSLSRFCRLGMMNITGNLRFKETLTWSFNEKWCLMRKIEAITKRTSMSIRHLTWEVEGH